MGAVATKNRNNRAGTASGPDYDIGKTRLTRDTRARTAPPRVSRNQQQGGRHRLEPDRKSIGLPRPATAAVAHSATLPLRRPGGAQASQAVTSGRRGGRRRYEKAGEAASPRALTSGHGRTTRTRAPPRPVSAAITESVQRDRRRPGCITTRTWPTRIKGQRKR